MHNLDLFQKLIMDAIPDAEISVQNGRVRVIAYLKGSGSRLVTCEVDHAGKSPKTMAGRIIKTVNETDWQAPTNRDGVHLGALLPEGAP